MRVREEKAERRGLRDCPIDDRPADPSSSCICSDMVVVSRHFCALLPIEKLFLREVFHYRLSASYRHEGNFYGKLC